MLGDLRIHTIKGKGMDGETWQKYELWAGMQVAVCNALELELKNQVGDNE